MDDPLRPFFDAAGLVILDGGLATELEHRGFDLADPLWSARLLLEAPEAIEALHLDYLMAGADIVTSASYQASFEGFAARGIAEPAAAELMRSSLRLAARARDRFWAEPANRPGRCRPLIAASVGPFGATRADGSEYHGDYGASLVELIDFHRPRLRLLADAGADLLACETIPSRLEAEAILAVLAELDGPPAWLSFSCRDAARVAHGEPFADCLALAAASPRVLAAGLNCCAPALVLPWLQARPAGFAKPLLAYPNRGERWDAAARRWRPAPAGDLGAEELAAQAGAWVQAGARLIGGCCRTGPADTRAIRAALIGSPAP